MDRHLSNYRTGGNGCAAKHQIFSTFISKDPLSGVPGGLCNPNYWEGEILGRLEDGSPP